MSRKDAVLITGASTGIGKACAHYLAEQGYHIFAGVRTQEDARGLHTEGITPLILDVTKPEQITAALHRVTTALDGRGLAGLINNAGIAKGGPLECLPIEDLRLQLEVNVIGLIALTQAFLPLIRKAQGRIINMSSISGRIALPFVGPYCASKCALEALSDALRIELIPWHIAVITIQPGPIATPIWDKSLAAYDQSMSTLPEETKRLYGDTLTTHRQAIIKAAERGIPPLEVAQVVHLALRAKRPKARYLIGSKTKKVAFIKKWLPESVWDWLLARGRA